MTHEIHYIAQLKDSKTGEIIEEAIVQRVKLKRADDFQELGLRHRAQLNLIEQSQNFLLTQQCKLFNDDPYCPSCGKKVRKQGEIESDFHDVFTDHKVYIARLSCTCGWKNKNTINALYGSASHPELLQLQATSGANHSFEKASTILNGFSIDARKINNDVTIMRNVTKVGEALDSRKKSSEWCKTKERAQHIVVTTDGGHVQNQEEGKHSFEELTSTVYRPKDLITLSKDRREIKKKITVASAKVISSTR